MFKRKNKNCRNGYEPCPKSGGWSCKKSCRHCGGTGRRICPTCGGLGCPR